jgi:hypothetical protein
MGLAEGKPVAAYCTGARTIHTRSGWTRTVLKEEPKPLDVSPHRMVPMPRRDTSRSLRPSFTVDAGLPVGSHMSQLVPDSAWCTAYT